MTSIESDRQAPDGGALPDPGALATVAEFVGGLRALKAVESLSLRELQRRTGLPRTTIAHALNDERPSLPPWDRVQALLRAFGVREDALARWKDAWTRIRLDSAKSASGDGCGEADAVASEEAAAPPEGGVQEGEVQKAPEGEVQEAPQGEVRQAGTAEFEVPAAPRVRFLPGRRVLVHGSLLGVGALLGAAVVFGLGGSAGGSPGAGGPVEAETCPPATAPQSGSTGLPTSADPRPPASADPARSPSSGSPVRLVQARPAWVGRPASDAQILSDADVDLPVTSPVTGGDALIVSVMLTSTCPGPVTVTDTQGDRFLVAGDVTDTRRHRTLLLAGFHVHALTTADSIRVVYPRASKYHIAVDEFRGISTVVARAHAHGEAGGTAFTTSHSRLECAAGDLVVAAVGSNSGTAPAYSAEWNALPVLRLSSYRLSSAYRVAPAEMSCAATGTTTAQWGAVVAAFR
ncbi:helix-turn-helix transcriptional regulator [Streptomyces sp. NPDC023838]|uniref:helix-turn-helix transcriptional regulator n=1 Tax=Streptomyces sp. NPDC023838 TaxID=3154325 RepID=UPI0033E7B395